MNKLCLIVFFDLPPILLIIYIDTGSGKVCYGQVSYALLWVINSCQGNQSLFAMVRSNKRNLKRAQSTIVFNKEVNNLPYLHSYSHTHTYGKDFHLYNPYFTLTVCMTLTFITCVKVYKY